MAGLTVLLARKGTAEGVLDVLQDLSAAGLIDPFLWVYEQDVSRSTVLATEVVGGRRVRTTLQTVLAARNFAQVRLGVLVPLIGAVEVPSAATHQQLSELLGSSAGGAAVTRVRFILARPGGPTVKSAVVEGWHNLLVAPEDSRGPGSGHVLLAHTEDQVVLGRHSAPALASALGMWADIEHSPFEATSPPPGPVLRVIRSFYRRFDATAAESELRRQVFDSSAALPLPRQRGMSVSYIDDSARAARQMAEALWTKHRAVLRGDRVVPDKVAAKSIGILEAIKMFFGFMLAAIRNAPSEWYAGLVRRTSSAVASAVHSTVYGSAESSYSVVFNGYKADGTPANMADMNAAAEQIADDLSEPGERHEHEARADLSELWKDYANGAMTLADGGERADGLPPIQVGSNRGVLRTVSDCVPSDRDTFVVPSSVAAIVGIDSVSANDVHAIVELLGRLRGAESDPRVGVEARAAMTELHSWATTYGRSYGSQVGKIMVDAIKRIVVEIREIMARDKARREAQDVSADIRNRQRKLALLMNIFAGVLLVVLVGLGVAIGFKVVAAVWGAGLMIGAVVVWMIVSMVTFMRGQRDLFQEMARRQSDSSQARADKLNLRVAVRDLNRLSGGYGQYLAWSKSVGTLLREPFGPESAKAAARPLIGFGLPLSTKVGSASPSANSVADAGLQVRRDLFSVGWLTPVWIELIRDAGSGLGALGQDIRENPKLLFSEEGQDSGSALDVWSSRLARGELTVTGSEALWQRVLSTLVTPESEVGRSLADHVETVADGVRQQVPIIEFLAGLDSDDQGVQYFDDELFSDTATAAGDARVTTNVRHAVKNGLGALSILTQLSDAIPEFQFRFCVEPSGQVGGGRAFDFADDANRAAPEADPFGIRYEEQRDSSDQSSARPPSEPPGSGTYVF
nr:magnesium transporter [Rhodococcus sp. (in: high G+C Gram-positive bacteria)]